MTRSGSSCSGTTFERRVRLRSRIRASFATMRTSQVESFDSPRKRSSAP